jgi:hypothetical protein
VLPSPERRVIAGYFEACHVYDTAVMARFGTAACNPRTDGVIESFAIAGQQGDEVTLAARVRPLDGSAVQDATLRVTLARQDGRLMVAAFTRLPASQTSPAASSAPPN